MYLSEIVSKYLLDKNKERKASTGFYPSYIGKCSRCVVYDMLGYEGTGDIDSRVLMVFENGNSFHNRMENIFEEAGILIAPELSVRDEKLKIRGRTDAIIMNPNPEISKYTDELVVTADGKELFRGPNNKIAIVELKSINNRGFNRVINYGSKEEHCWQMQLYMFLTGIKQGVIYYENKDNQNTIEEWVVYDEKLALKLIDKIGFINKCVEDKVIPKKEYSRSSFQCSWCEYYSLCWESSASYKSIDELI